MKTKIYLKYVLQILLCSGFVMFFLSTQALAQGIGVTEITQRNVPVRITKGGSYVLTTNLTTTNPN